MADFPLLCSRTDLPSWAEPHWSILQTVDLAGVDLEDQIKFLRTRGLTAERALRLVMSLPAPTPQGHLARVRRAGRLLNQDPARFWPVVESLSVYWKLHPWSILGEPLRKDCARQWSQDLGGPWSEGCLCFVGIFGRHKRLPSGVCASRLVLDQFPYLRHLPEGWIVGDLVVRDCPRLEGSLADWTVLGSSTIERCPHFQSDRFPALAAGTHNQSAPTPGATHALD